MNEFATVLSHALITGAGLSAALGVLIFGSLYANARLWLHDYPRPMQERVAPRTPREQWAMRVMAVAFFAVIIGGLALGLGQLEQALGGRLSFLAAYGFSLIVINLFNLFDAVVVDYAILARIKPKFAILPGTEDLLYLFDDTRMHVTNYLKGVVFSLVASLIVAVVAVL